MGLAYKRVVIKLSGEALAGEKKFGLDYDIVYDICKNIKLCVDMGAQIAIVVGGGNFWRGRSNQQMDRALSDHMGMLATIMNSLALSDAFESLGVDVRVQTAIQMHAIAEPYIRKRAIRHLEKGRVVIFGGGTGSPYFSTDTASSLRAAEIDAQIIFKVTMVDGVYDSDPIKNKSASKYDTLTFAEMFSRELAVMDMTAATMCKDNHIPIKVFSIADPYNIVLAMQGENIGTLIE